MTELKYIDEEKLEVTFWEYLGRTYDVGNKEAFKAQVRKLLNALAPLNTLAAEAHRIAVEHGFTDATIGEDIALMHSELSEALEDHRNGHAPTETWYEQSRIRTSKHDTNDYLEKPCGIPSEMADVVIRVAHFCAKHGIDLDRAVAEKMEYNASREYKHGKVL